jgi:hypothetical protein
MNQTYIDTVRLLLAIAPAVFASGRFAMKGGTALNLFVQEMPRLSVDIDLVFVDHHPDRQAALQAIAKELATVQAALAGQASDRGLSLRQNLLRSTHSRWLRFAKFHSSVALVSCQVNSSPDTTSLRS